jgi:4-amino-4-deoxy-L-arabinose transferase-like glycosyltransferase
LGDASPKGSGTASSASDAASNPGAPDESHRGAQGRVPSWVARVGETGALIVLMAVSLVAKLAHTFEYLVYPDSYFYLLTARNIAQRGVPWGQLGPGGMWFPPSEYASMKLTYPVLVTAGILAGLPAERAGHAVSIACAVLAVPAVWWAVRRLTGSSPASVLAAALVATSPTLTLWTGFVMSDSASLMLAFVMLGLMAHRRDDEFSQLGDIAVGIVAAALVLSRPTYVVTLPLLAWGMWRGFGWTPKRAATALVSGALLLSVLALAWFPEARYAVGIGSRLLPVAAVGVAGVALVLLIGAIARFLRTYRVLDRVARIIAVTLAALFVAFRIVESPTAMRLPFSYYGLAEFGVWETATILLLVFGAWALARHDAKLTTALLGCALVMTAVNYWLEPVESRYLLQLSAFLIPVAASSVMLLQLDWTGSTRRRLLSALVCGVVAVALVSAVVLQTKVWLKPPFKAKYAAGYPALVAEKAVTFFSPADDVVVAALPWPMYYHTSRAVWGMGSLYDPEFVGSIDPSTSVLVVCDASMRHHYPVASSAIAIALDPVAMFRVPSMYLYGYEAIEDRYPVELYRMKAADLRKLQGAAPRL